ncbi:MAG TPA: hypothetical protein VNZ52_17070, partial [Candidatus Thermoplasmatota archaeon]|nr:hypothetical protein [Candidatus Thermoplasmatota archaeon]
MLLLSIPAVLTPVSATFAPNPEADATLRIANAFAALERDGPTEAALAELRAALRTAPPALRSSPALREMDRLLTTVEDPYLARALLPLLKSGGNDTAALTGHIDQVLALLEQLDRDLGMQSALLASEFQRLNATASRFNLSDPEAFEASLQHASPEEVAAFVGALAGFVHTWNATSRSPVAANLDAMLTALLPVQEALVRAEAGALPSAAVQDAYRDALLALQQVADRYDPATLFPDDHLTAEDRALLAKFKADLKANLTAMAGGEDVLVQEAFLDVPEALQYPYTAGMGPVSVDGVPVDALPVPVPFTNLDHLLPQAQNGDAVHA